MAFFKEKPYARLILIPWLCYSNKHTFHGKSTVSVDL